MYTCKYNYFPRKAFKINILQLITCLMIHKNYKMYGDVCVLWVYFLIQTVYVVGSSKNCLCFHCLVSHYYSKCTRGTQSSFESDIPYFWLNFPIIFFSPPNLRNTSTHQNLNLSGCLYSIYILMYIYISSAMDAIFPNPSKYLLRPYIQKCQKIFSFFVLRVRVSAV